MIETTLLEDSGAVDRELAPRGLLAEPGIIGVVDGRRNHSLSVEYDPDVVADEKLLEVLCRRYAGAGPIKGEEIVAVADDWQRQGLGKTLLHHLIDYARSHGATRLYSMDAIDNAPMRKLASQVGFKDYPDPDDIHQVIYSLDLLA